MSMLATRKILAKIKDFWVKYEYKIVLVIGFCLVSAISWQFGYLQGQKWPARPLIIEKPSDTPGEVKIESSNASSASGNAIAPVQAAKQVTVVANSNCAFVGSKNSTKFYVPTCSWAKRIKPENLVCYKSEQEAFAKGKTKSDCK